MTITDCLSKKLEDNLSEAFRKDADKIKEAAQNAGPGTPGQRGENGEDGAIGRTETGTADKEDEGYLFSFAHQDLRESERSSYQEYSYWRSTFNTFLHRKVAVVFLIIMCALLLFTAIQPLLPGQAEPNKIFFDEKGMALSNRSPGDEFWFGSNNAGQDLWSRIWSGTRTSLKIGFIVSVIQAIVGIAIGVLWGYVRKLDFFFTELWNIFDNVPSTIVLVLLAYIMKRNIFTLIFAMSITGWLSMALFIRNQTIIIRDRDFNLASRCLGTPIHRIVFKNLLPYIVSVIMLRMALTIPEAISSEVFVTYIGLGLPVNIPSLGNLVNTGRMLMMSPDLRYQLIFPTIVLSIITISFYVIGNAFSDSADPKNHK